MRPAYRQEKSGSLIWTLAHPRLPGGVFHPHPVLPRRRNLFQHAIALVRWRFERPCSSVLPRPISLFSFPTRELRHLLFRAAPRARRFVSTFRLSLHHLGKPAAARCLVSYARVPQTFLAVARLPASPPLALHRQ